MTEDQKSKEARLLEQLRAARAAHELEARATAQEPATLPVPGHRRALPFDAKVGVKK